jgi:hypothetical protein
VLHGGNAHQWPPNYWALVEDVDGAAGGIRTPDALAHPDYKSGGIDRYPTLATISDPFPNRDAKVVVLARFRK